MLYEISELNFLSACCISFAGALQTMPNLLVYSGMQDSSLDSASSNVSRSMVE